MKRLIYILLVAAALFAVWWFFIRAGKTTVEYETSPIVKGDMTQIVTATGTLNPVVNVQVGSQISGNILKLYADFNSPVKAGQVVAQLDPAIYQAIVHQMEGDLASGQAAMELAALTAKRKKELVEQHAAAQADLDSADAALHQAVAQVQIKQANLEKAKADLDHCTIYSPIDGTVISRAVDVGQTVAAAMNAPILFTVANDLSKMQIDSAVAEADVGNAEVAQDVDFTVDAFPYRTFHGKVSQVRNAATTVQNVVTYDVVISVVNEDLKLKPGMTANVSIIVARRQDALKLPNAALRFRPPDAPVTPAPMPVALPSQSAAGVPTPEGRPEGPGKKPGGGRGGGKNKNLRPERTVYVMRPGATKPEPVLAKFGITDGITTEVLGGLKEGDLVVTGATVLGGIKPGAAGPSNPLGGGGMRMR